MTGPSFPLLLVTADDRTGALETAGVIATVARSPVPVVVWESSRRRSTGLPSLPEPPFAVVHDIGTRHLPGAVAATRVCAVHDDAPPASWHAHKIDSTLRGAWAHEAVALSAGRRVLLVPSAPAAGRTCIGGVVLVDGRPVHESPMASDPRAPVRSSRPADHLLAAGLPPDRLALLGPDDVAAWMRHGTTPCAVVVDLPDEESLAIAVAGWCAAGDPSTVVAGPAGVHGAVARALASGGRGRERDRPGPASGEQTHSLPGPVLVVVGSAHPSARAQLEALRSADLPGVEILATAEPGGASVEATATLADLAGRVREARERIRPRSLVLVGGDTAAAVLGDATVVVDGAVGVGMPWGRVLDPVGDREVAVVTKPGGFGDRDALVRLLREKMA